MVTILSFIKTFIRLQKNVFKLMYGIWKISKLKQPVISIFGGSHLKSPTPFLMQAHTIAFELAKNNIAILTGGGTGIMNATACGAHHFNAPVWGITVRNLDQHHNPCLSDYIEFDYFFMRKLLLMNYSKAFLVFPGGYGTLDELSELLTLIKTKKINRSLIILVGREYWQPLVSWIIEKALVFETINPEDTTLFSIIDDTNEILHTLKTYYSKI